MKVTSSIHNVMWNKHNNSCSYCLCCMLLTSMCPPNCKMKRPQVMITASRSDLILESDEVASWLHHALMIILCQGMNWSGSLGVADMNPQNADVIMSSLTEG